ncbi:uncharacterized protein LOC118459108 [Anopheles albimanus]|uniref:uncharacterized protein LOC118459108 n=1 Tax=Anopheles albimanus TaxID=7167 RepID=UPI00163EB73A|nr:uncharacterized protein LOC118459108 [Anopheles albimanus]
MLRDERISPDIVQAQGQALQKLRLGYRELFEEIDRLSSQRSASVSERPCYSKVDARRQEKELDNLLVYARKFIREARAVVPVQHDNRAVQCDAAEKCNKVVETPVDWIDRPEDGTLSSKVGSLPDGQERTTAIQIVQILPKGVIETPPVEPPLNNQKVAVSKEVRNIGTNVNFVAPRTVKRTNHLHGYVIPPPLVQRCAASSKPQSAPSQRSLFVKPLTKVRGTSASGVPGSLKKAVEPPRRTFTNAQFKKLFDQYLSMKRSKDDSSGKPIGEENGSGDHREGGDLTALAPVSSVVTIDLEAGEQMKEQPEAVKEVTQVPEDGAEKMTESFGFSSHMLPSVSIKGRWDVNLQVRQTSNIAILENRSDGCYAATNEQNVKYVEMKHGFARSAQAKEADQVQIPSTSETVKETPMATIPTYDAIDEANRMETNRAKEEPANEPTESECSETIQKDVTIVRVPKSAYKTASLRKCATRNPNRYLEPFTRLTSEQHPPKPAGEVMLELFDDDDSSSSTDDEADNDADTIRSLLNLNSEHDDCSSTDTEQPVGEAAAAAAEKIPLKTPQCQRSLLEVSSIPTLRSPSGDVHLEISESPDTVEYSTAGRSGSKFLENLRIWKSAVEVQSQNMKLGHELTENLDALKENIQTIKQQTEGMVNLAHHYRIREEEMLTGDQSIGATHHGERTMSSSLAVPPAQQSKSCECFGCQSTFEGPSMRPATSPPLDTKRFQRAVLERNPRYARTIAKICDLGSKGQWQNTKETGSIGGLREADLARIAARKFLQSWQKTRSREGSSCSSTQSAPLRSDYSHMSAKLHSENLVNGIERWQTGQMSEGVQSCGSDDQGSVESGWCGIRSVAESDSSIALDIDCASESGESSSVPLIFRTGSTISDEGEVLSHGEIKLI